MASKFQMKKARGGQFMFNLIANNGRVVLTSERYKTKASALNGIKSVKKHAKSDKYFDRGKTRSGGGKFDLHLHQYCFYDRFGLRIVFVGSVKRGI